MFHVKQTLDSTQSSIIVKKMFDH